MLDFAPPDLSYPELLTPESRRSPVAALLLSMLFPGLGHLYLGLRRTAAWLSGLEVLAVLVMIGGSGNYHGQSLFVVPSLYCFGMADAYFAARERNAGVTSLLTGANPRIAAILNLLTKGFGYFYLGDRVKGAVCFVVVSAVGALILIHTSIWTSILAISLQIAVAVDAYRVGRQRLFARHPVLLPTSDGTPDAVERSNPGGLQPGIASAFFLVLAAVSVLTYATLRAMSGEHITTLGVLELGPSGLIYRNLAEHIEMTAPGNWSESRAGVELVKLSGEGSSFIVTDQYAIFASDTAIDSNVAAILERHPEAHVVRSEGSLAGQSYKSFQASFQNESGVTVTQRFVVLRRGLKMFIVIETWVDGSQRHTLDGIEQSMRL